MKVYGAVCHLTPICVSSPRFFNCTRDHQHITKYDHKEYRIYS